MDNRLITINGRGLRNKIKRRAIFKYIKTNKIQVSCLQECHILDKDIELWEKEWGGEMFVLPGSEYSKGQIILVSKKLNANQYVEEKIGDRILKLSFVLNDEKFSIVNVYGPNNDFDKKKFLIDLYNVCVQIPNDVFYTIAGDYNMYLNELLDNIAGAPHDKHVVQKFNDFITKLGLVDVWRIFHGEDMRHTWSNVSSPWIARRLDFILCNDLMFDRIHSCEIVDVPHTDHKGVLIEFSSHNLSKGPGYWKFNSSCLSDPRYIALIKDVIRRARLEFSDCSSQLVWDISKIKIREASISFSKMKSGERQMRLKVLKNQLREVEDKLSLDRNNEELLKKLQDTKLAIDLQSLYSAQGAQTRSRVKWIEEGEKNTKFFLGLEKTSQNNKLITRLTDENGRIYTKQDELLDYQAKFYKNLFSKKVNFSDVRSQFENFTKDIQIPKLDDESRASCEGSVDLVEAEAALKQLNKDSAPGYDGLTGTFYLAFWSDIGDLVVDSFNEAFDLKCMSISQRRAIITLIHKGKELSRDDLGNWRPISLTNFDYKILAKILANRFKGVISDVIDDDQTAYIRGRNITTILRLIDDVIEYVEFNNKTGAILALDYKKAFDSISKEYLIECFKVFGFGVEFIQWVETLMSQTESSVIHFGWISEFFPVLSGVRQGCPFSCVAFILGVEILALKIRQTPDIIGIRIPAVYGDVPVKIQLYADDNTLFPSNANDVRLMLRIVNAFSIFSGLYLNFDKTEGMWIGSSRSSMDEIGSFKWRLGKSVMKILGVYFSNYDRASNLEANWKPKIDNMITKIKCWEKRNLSIMGKVIITKTFLISQFNYVMQALFLPENVLRDLNTIIFRFLWKRKYSNRRAFEKVKRDVLCLGYENGGLKMINVFDMQHAFIIKWFQQIFTNRNSLFSQIPQSLLEILGSDFSALKCNISSKEFKGLGLISSQFWRQAIKVWIDNNRDQDVPPNNYFGETIWNNDKIRYKHNVLFWKSWCDCDFTYVGDLFLDDNFLTLDNAKNSLGKNATVHFQYFALFNALPAEWRVPQAGEWYLNEPMFCKEKISLLSTKSVRLNLVKMRKKSPGSLAFWGRKFPDVDVLPYFKLLYNATKETRLRTLQWKILHNIYPTNILLYKMGKVNSSNCDYCGVRDFIEHFFCDCITVRPLWSVLETKIELILGQNFVITEIFKLFGVTAVDVPACFVDKINHLLLLAKMCISKFKYGSYHDIVLLFEYELELRGLD